MQIGNLIFWKTVIFDRKYWFLTKNSFFWQFWARTTLNTRFMSITRFQICEWFQIRECLWVRWNLIGLRCECITIVNMCIVIFCIHSPFFDLTMNSFVWFQIFWQSPNKTPGFGISVKICPRMRSSYAILSLFRSKTSKSRF